jgi:hypothetical protein
VSLSAERNGLQRRRAALQVELAAAERREAEAQRIVSQEDARSWLARHWQALLASHGEFPAADVRKTVDDKAEHFRSIVNDELIMLRNTFADLMALHAGGAQIFAPVSVYEEQHRKDYAHAHEVRDLRRYRAVYNQLHAEFAAQRSPSFPAVPDSEPTGAVYTTERSPSYESSVDDAESAERAIRAVTQEVTTLAAELSLLGKPGNLLAGIGVLAAFAGVSICWPLWEMTRRPAELSPLVRTEMFVGFCVGLAAVVTYISLSILGLSRSPN